MLQAVRRAVITGAGQGLGRAIAERLAGDGLHVVALDIDGGDANMDGFLTRPELSVGMTAFSSQIDALCVILHFKIVRGRRFCFAGLLG